MSTVRDPKLLDALDALPETQTQEDARIAAIDALDEIHTVTRILSHVSASVHELDKEEVGFLSILLFERIEIVRAGLKP